MSVEVRRAADRFVTRSAGISTWHCFSFGNHYDPAHVAHGPVVAHDEHLLEPGAGFPPHPHRDLEIVSWVLEASSCTRTSTARRSCPRAGCSASGRAAAWCTASGRARWRRGSSSCG
jgi:redox-sensitive bicupin YhaK (pirin superfamily)